MATLTTKTTIASRDFFSSKLDVETSNTVSTLGDDRMYGTDKISLGVRATATITQVDTAAANINGDDVILVDADNNRHVITYSSTHSNLESGRGSIGSITVTSANLSTWNGKTIIIVDNTTTGARTLTLTFSSSVAVTSKTSTSLTAIANTVGLSGKTSITQIRGLITQAINQAAAAGDISLVARNSVTNENLLEVEQTVIGVGGNTTITGTAESSTTTHVDFVSGGIGYTSSYAGLAGNAETAAAHAKSLYNSIKLAYTEGLINLNPGASITGAVITLTTTGPYKEDASIAIQGSAIRGGEATTTVFSGAGVPQALRADRINSKYEKAYFYASNTSSVGTINLYTKETTAVVEGDIRCSTNDLTGTPNIDGDVGKTILLTSAEGNVYTLTSVAPGAATANTRTGDTTADYVIATTMEETLENISDTLELLNNKAGRETRPFVLEITSDEQIGKIRQTKVDAGTAGNTSITGTFIDVTQVTGNAFTGGADTYHLLARLGPKEHLYMPISGSPVIYADAETSQSEIEYLILES